MKALKNNINNAAIHAIGVVEDKSILKNIEDVNLNIVSLAIITKKLLWLPRPIRYTLNFIELFVKMSIRIVALRPKVLHCHDTLVLPIGSFVKTITGAKLVYDAHELESDKNGQTYVLSKSTLLMEKLCWKSINLLISVSDSILQWYRRNLRDKPSVLVLNSPEISHIGNLKKCNEIDKKYIHNKYNIPRQSLVFIYLGFLDDGRGIDYYLDIFASHETTSHIVFMGNGQLLPKVEEYADRHNKIHLHRMVPHEHVVEFTQNADVGLCLIENISLSDFYCLPNKLFEYVFAGVPVLASNFPEIAKLVNKYNLGICTGLDHASIIKSIQNIEKNKSKYDFKTDDLFELSWDSQAKRLLEYYAELLKCNYIEEKQGLN